MFEDGLPGSKNFAVHEANLGPQLAATDVCCSHYSARMPVYDSRCMYNFSFSGNADKIANVWNNALVREEETPLFPYSM